MNGSAREIFISENVGAKWYHGTDPAACYICYQCLCKVVQHVIVSIRNSGCVAFISITALFVSVHSRYLSTDTQKVVGGVLVGTGLWVSIIMIMRNVLKSLLSWHGWMYERHGSISWTSRAWMVRWHVYIWTILNKFEGHWGEIFLCTVTVWINMYR